jgi:hypothetical protein
MLLAAVQGMAGVSTGYARLPQQPVFYLVANCCHYYVLYVYHTKNRYY